MLGQETSSENSDHYRNGLGLGGGGGGGGLGHHHNSYGDGPTGHHHLHHTSVSFFFKSYIVNSEQITNDGSYCEMQMDPDSSDSTTPGRSRRRGIGNDSILDRSPTSNGGLNGGVPPSVVIPRARHPNQVNYAIHRGQVYMW